MSRVLFKEKSLLSIPHYYFIKIMLQVYIGSICGYLTQSDTAAHVIRKNSTPEPEPRAAGVPVYAVNITVYHLRKTALRASTQNKRRINQQPPERRFQWRSSEKIVGFARVIKLEKTCPGESLKKLPTSSYYGEYPVAFGQKREIVGVGQSDTANNTLCRYCFQVHPFLAKKAPGTSQITNTIIKAGISNFLLTALSPLLHAPERGESIVVRGYYSRLYKDT